MAAAIFFVVFFCLTTFLQISTGYYISVPCPLTESYPEYSTCGCCTPVLMRKTGNFACYPSVRTVAQDVADAFQTTEPSSSEPVSPPTPRKEAAKKRKKDPEEEALEDILNLDQDFSKVPPKRGLLTELVNMPASLATGLLSGEISLTSL